MDGRLTSTESRAADSLSELSQTCATCSMPEIKSSHEFSDQVLHSKQSHFYEPFWMKSARLASWYSLMGTQTITSGHSFSSPTEITPSQAFKELYRLCFCSKRVQKEQFYPCPWKNLLLYRVIWMIIYVWIRSFIHFSLQKCSIQTCYSLI